MERDKVDRQSVVDRMKNQMGEREKKKMADYIIVNDGKQMIIPQILEIHKKLKRKSING
jgi:dephospho-CoA kinase